MAPPAPPLPPLANSSQPGLTRQEKADAIRSARSLLDEVGTNWEYHPPPLPRPPPPSTKAPPPSRSLSLRSGGLGSWRPSEPAGTDAIAITPTVEEEFEGDEYSSASDASSSSSSTLSFSSESRINGASYRRPSTPTTMTSQRKRKRRRRKTKPREGMWLSRVDDSDFEIPSEGDRDDGALKSPYRFHSPDAIPSPENQRHRRERWLEEQMAENPGLALWTARREAWTGGDGKGNVPVGQSRFADNPLTGLVTPEVYADLYSRCVVQGSELPVPVNLKIMTDALVQGWKSDDQWPPKPTPAEPGIRAPMGRMGALGNGGGGGGGNALNGGPGSREEALAVVGKMGGRVRRYLGIK